MTLGRAIVSDKTHSQWLWVFAYSCVELYESQTPQTPFCKMSNTTTLATHVVQSYKSLMPPSGIGETLRLARQAMMDNAEQFNRIKSLMPPSDLTETIRRAAAVLRQIDPAQWERMVSDYGTDEQVDPQQIGEELDQIAESPTPLQMFFEFFEKPRSPAQKFVACFIIHFLLPIFTAIVAQVIIQTYFSPVVEPQRPIIIVRERQRIAVEIGLPKSQLETCRIVNKHFVVVKTSRRRNAPSAGYLNAGDVVVLIENRKKWSHILWYDRVTGDYLEGWVRSKYLTRFRRMGDAS